MKLTAETPVTVMVNPSEDGGAFVEVRVPTYELSLVLDADSMDDLHSALVTLANDLDHDGRESRQVTSGGWASSYDLDLTLTDPTMDGDTYRELLREWTEARKEARRNVR